MNGITYIYSYGVLIDNSRQTLRMYSNESFHEVSIKMGLIGNIEKSKINPYYIKREKIGEENEI